MYRAINGLPLSDIKLPSTCIMLGDAGNLSNGNPYYLIDWIVNQSDNAVPPQPRHNDGANLAFCDGHGKWLSQNQYSTWSTAAVAPPPTPNLWALQ